MTKARDLGDFISDGTIAETVTADGLDLGDNERIRLGDSQDLQLFHNGSASYITDSGTGNLVLQTSSALVVQNSAGTETMLQAFENGAVNLYHDNSVKLATSASGATVTGTIAVSDSFNATSGTFTVQSNGTDILNLTSTVMSPQTDGAISLGSATNGFNNMYLDGSAYVSGNVGAGTSSPQRQIHSVDSNGEVLRLQRDGAFTGSWDLSIGTQTTGDFTVYDNENSQRAITVEKLTGFSGTSAMYIDSGGNVGIGRADPADAKFGDGSSAFVTTGSSASIGSTQFATNLDDSSFIGMWSGHSSADPALAVKNTKNLTFGNWSSLNGVGGFTERLRIGTSGQLGIGGANYGTSGQVLTSGGSSAAPTWADAAEASFTFSATASGSIDANRIAAVNSDGTMSALYSTSSGSVTNVTTTNDARRLAMAPVTDNLYFYMWDDDNTATANANKVVLVQRSTGTVDANTLTVGTPVEVNNDSRIVCDAVYDPDNQRITYFWALGSASTMYYRMYSFSGTTLTQTGSGSFSVQAMTTSYPAYISATYNTTHNCIVLLYKRSSDGSFVAKLIDPGTTSLTIANEYNLGTYNAYTGRAVECAATGAHVFVQQKVSDARAYVRAGTISGSGSGLSLTLGTEVDVSGANGYGGDVPIGIFDVPENSNYTNTMCVQHAQSSTYAKYCLFSLSGTTVTAQTTGQAYGGTNTGDTLEGAYSPETGKVMQVWTSGNSLRARPIDVTLATPAEADNELSISGSIGNSHATSRTPVVNDGSAYFAVGFVYYTGSTYPRIRAIATTDSNYNQWVGYTESALSNGDSGTFTVLGPITTAPTSNPGNFIYVSKDGSLTTTSPNLDGDKLGITTGNGNGIITRVRNYQMYTN